MTLVQKHCSVSMVFFLLDFHFHARRYWSWTRKKPFWKWIAVEPQCPCWLRGFTEHPSTERAYSVPLKLERAPSDLIVHLLKEEAYSTPMKREGLEWTGRHKWPMVQPLKELAFSASTERDPTQCPLREHTLCPSQERELSVFIEAAYTVSIKRGDLVYSLRKPTLCPLQEKT